MPLFQYRIQVKGNFSKKGFGFSCMRLAYQNNIKGTLFYESNDSVILEITGNEQDINTVIDQYQKIKYISDVLILNKNISKYKLTDFIMLNQID